MSAAQTFDDPELLARLADLAIRFGSNVQPGQIVAIGAEPGQEPIARAVAESAYRAGAKYVEVAYFDPYVKRARIKHAAEETLDFVPPWLGERVLELGRQHAARIGLSGLVNPGLFDDLDPARVGKDSLPRVREAGQVVNDRTTNWTIIPGATRAWAQHIFGGLEPQAAWERLCAELIHVLRLDEPDPVAAWMARGDALLRAAAAMNERRFEALRFVSEGTDLTVGLLPSSNWEAAKFETVDGVVHRPNLPSEEIFSAPDPERVDGVVRSTKPLEVGGAEILGLEVEFRGGRAVRIDAEQGADVLRAQVAKDDGAARLGEVALVDGDGRIGPLGTVFYDTLLDENAASHIALGMAYAICVGEEDSGRINKSEIHIDFMIGAPDQVVYGVEDGGAEVPVLAEGRWQI
ncbi:MAG: aminopeptidase [Baekduia sp.]